MALIARDSGHGLYTAGKRCHKKLDPNETREWILNDRVGDYLDMYLISAGHTILRVDDPDGSTDVSLPSRVSKANKAGADFYISLHHDARGKVFSGGGTTVFVCPNAQAKSREAQEAIYRNAIKYAALKGNRADGTLAKSLYVLNYTNMPACLVECGFMDSTVDIQYILNPEWSQLIARGIAEGICEVFGGVVDSKALTVSTTIPTATNKLVVDGSWGGATTRMTQKVMGTTVDGIVSRQPASNKKYLEAAYEGAWQFKRTGIKGGSVMVKAIQKLVGAKEDGWMGKKTVMAMQRFLNGKGFNCGAVDGYMGRNTVKAWQRYINSRL